MIQYITTIEEDFSPCDQFLFSHDFISDFTLIYKEKNDADHQFFEILCGHNDRGNAGFIFNLKIIAENMTYILKKKHANKTQQNRRFV